jgi:ABC-type transport system substrate-binding protein
MMEKILQNQGGCRANSYHPGTTGMPADLTPYPYDPEKARELIKASGFEGSEVRVITSSGEYTKSNEIVEAVIGYWNDVGLDASVKFVERSISSQTARDTGGVPVGATEHPLIAEGSVFNARFHGHTNDVIEPEATWSYASCDEYGSAWSCFPDEYQQMKEAMGTQDPEQRAKNLEQWHRWWHETLVHIPVHDIRPVFGFAENLEWAPRPDFIVWPQTMRFTD